MCANDPIITRGAILRETGWGLRGLLSLGARGGVSRRGGASHGGGGRLTEGGASHGGGGKNVGEGIYTTHPPGVPTP